MDTHCPICGEETSACTCGGALLPHEGDELPESAPPRAGRRQSRRGVSWQLIVSLVAPPAALLLLCGLPPLAIGGAAVALVIGCVLYWQSPDGSEHGRIVYAIVAAAFILAAIALWFAMSHGLGWSLPHGWPTWPRPSAPTSPTGTGP